MKGKDLPAYIHRRKRDGALLFRRRRGDRTIECRLNAQSPKGQPVPFEVRREREDMLDQFERGHEVMPGGLNPADWIILDYGDEKKDREPANYEFGKYIPRRLREAVAERDEGRCAYCGRKPDAFEIDHIIPRSRGGTNTMENLTVACVDCNRSKSNKTPEEWNAKRLG